MEVFRQRLAEEFDAQVINIHYMDTFCAILTCKDAIPAAEKSSTRR